MEVTEEEERPGTCTYVGGDPCYGICKTPAMDAYDLCDDYCIGLSRADVTLGDAVISSIYNECW